VKCALVLVVVLVLVGGAGAECVGSCANCTSGAFDHSSWQAVLDEFLYVNQTLNGVPDETLFDYEGLRRSNSTHLQDYLDQLAALPATWQDQYSQSDQFAILVNTYNSWAVQMVAQHPTKMRMGRLTWPIRSIRDISGFLEQVWNMPAGVLAGTTYSLQEVEDYVRGFGDARVHACLVCASASCPNLQPFAFDGAVVNLQKNHSMEQFLANPKKGLALDEATGTLTASSIFLWYANDFVNDTICNDCTCLNGGQPFGEVLNFILAFAPQSVVDFVNSYQGNLTAAYFGYDWDLNNYADRGPQPTYD